MSTPFLSGPIEIPALRRADARAAGEVRALLEQAGTPPIGRGADQIDLHYFGPAHTGGDAYVVFPALRVMHVGDAMPTCDM